MTPQQENIIKDKLLEYEVPFEEAHWEDFQKRAAAKGLEIPSKKSGKAKYYSAGLIALLLLGIGGTIAYFSNSSQPQGFLANHANLDAFHTSEVNNLQSTDNASKNERIFNPFKNKNLNNSNKNTSINPTVAQSTTTDIVSKTEHTKNNNKHTKSNYNKLWAKSKIENSYADEANVQSNIANQNNWNSASNTSAVVASKSANIINESNSTLHKSTYLANREVSLTPSSNSTFAYNQQQSNAELEHDNLTSGQTVENQNYNASNNYNSAPKLNTNVNRSILADKEQCAAKACMPYDAIDAFQPAPPVLAAEQGSLEQSEEIDWSNKKEHNWEIGLVGGIGLNIPSKSPTIANEQIQTFKRRPNITAGANFRYKFNKRIDFETGFYYKSIDQSFAATQQYRDDINLVDITETTIVNRLRSFEVPFGVNVRLTQWLALSSGLSFSFQKPVNAFVKEDIQNPTGIDIYQIEGFKALKEYKNYGIKQFDARVYLGLTFDISPYLGFRMLVNQGLMDRTNNAYYNSNQYNMHTDYMFSTIIRFNPKVLK